MRGQGTYIIKHRRMRRALANFLPIPRFSWVNSYKLSSLFIRFPTHAYQHYPGRRRRGTKRHTLKDTQPPEIRKGDLEFLDCLCSGEVVFRRAGGSCSKSAGFG